MREIKCRAWGRNSHCMHYFNLWGSQSVTHPGYLKCVVCGVACDPLDLTEPMLWCGFTDKNGADIYEGDFFQDSSGISIVLWKESKACICLRRKGWMFDHYFGEAVDPDQGEVIGSVTENPEIMDKALCDGWREDFKKWMK